MDPNTVPGTTTLPPQGQPPKPKNHLGGSDFDTVTIPINCLPWLKTTGGDVHTNQGINAPGGP